MKREYTITRTDSLSVPKLKVHKPVETSVYTSVNETGEINDSAVSPRYKLRTTLTTEKSTEEKET